MRKSDITRKPFTGRRKCRYESALGDKCHARAPEEMTVTSYPTGLEPLTGSSLLCTKHADQTVAHYKREWASHPEMFE
jgi:hypothetical protein